MNLAPRTKRAFAHDILSLGGNHNEQQFRFGGIRIVVTRSCLLWTIHKEIFIDSAFSQSCCDFYQAARLSIDERSKNLMLLLQRTY